MLNLGPEYEDKDLNIQFCVRDWNIIVEALKCFAGESADEKKIEDANTICAAIESELELDERDEIGWDQAIKTVTNDMSVMGMDTSNVTKLGCFISDVESDPETAVEQWAPGDVDTTLSAFRDQYSDNDPKLYSIIEEAVIHCEDLLGSH